MQPTIQLYHDQHARALRCAEDIATSFFSDAEIRKRAAEIRMLLSEMAGTLKPHFASEDRLVYPTLMNDADQSIATVAKHFWQEMGPITEVVNAFLDSWRRASAIENAPSDFAAQAATVFQALKERISAEETSLYPLLLRERPHSPA